MERRPWTEIEPADAVELVLGEDSEVIGPRNEEGQICPWPWGPQQLKDVPLGQFHCHYCGAMVVAGLPHLDYTESEMTEEQGPATYYRELPARMREVAATEMGNEPMKETLRKGADALQEALEALAGGAGDGALEGQLDDLQCQLSDAEVDLTEVRTKLDAVASLLKEHQSASRKTIKVEDLAEALDPA